jgi:glycogen debranching enzyme
VLAAYQGEKDDPYTEEESGKIPHDLRFGEMARAGETPHTPYYGTADATALFVVVAHAAYHVTGDLALVEELRPSIVAALRWIDSQTDGGTRFASYRRRSPRGLDNQGWKDSQNGVLFPDGRRAVPPIALAEIQGYSADAYRRGAELLAALGDQESAHLYAERAQRMIDLIEDELWLPERARDRDRQASSGTGFVLGIRRRLLVRDPFLPPGLDRITIGKLRVGDARVSLRIEREGHRCHVDVLDVEAGEVRTCIELG